MVCWFELDMGGPEPLSSFESGLWRPCVHWLPPRAVSSDERCAVAAQRSDTMTRFRWLAGGRPVAVPAAVQPLVCVAAEDPTDPRQQDSLSLLESAKPLVRSTDPACPRPPPKFPAARSPPQLPGPAQPSVLSQPQTTFDARPVHLRTR